jgi:hypothetical protein
MPTLPSIEEEPSVSQPDKVVSIYACALRLARLAADGTTPAGATNGYISNNLITLSATPDIDEGTDHSSPNACGDDAFPVKDRPKTKRYNLAMTLEVKDPEITELLTSNPLILSTPASARVLAANGTTATGTFVLTSPTMAATALDIGATITGTGVGVGAVISAINSPTSVTVTVASTATASGTIAFTITPVAQSIGGMGPELGVQASDNGVSMELFTKAYAGANPATVLPFIKHAFTKTTWREDTREFANAKQGQSFVGEGTYNSNFGNGPWNDWVEASPSSRLLTRAYGWHRAAALPTPAIGYVAVPTQA